MAIAMAVVVVRWKYRGLKKKKKSEEKRAVSVKRLAVGQDREERDGYKS